MNSIRFREAILKIQGEVRIGSLEDKVDYSPQGANLFKISRSKENFFMVGEDSDNQSWQYLLFGQTDKEIIPYSWIQASWNYIDKFRCNFGFNLAEVLLYPTITIVGTPDIPIPVTQEQENEMRKSLESIPKFQIERLWVRTPEELSTLLEERIKENQSFYGGDVGPHAPII